MTSNVLLVAAVPLAPLEARPGSPPLRGLTNGDVESLADLWMRSYPAAVTADETRESVIDDMARAFAGGYGDLVPGATLGIHVGADLIGAIMTVHRAPWDDAPAHPFVIELFIAPEHRRSGLAGRLLARASESVAELGETRIALRVEVDNSHARALYAGLGFH